jgi:hypothetical protein
MPPKMRVVISLLVQWLLLSPFLSGGALGQNGPSGNGGAGSIIISEIMYHPYHRPETAEDTGREWIELFNRGLRPSVLAGWRLSDGVEFAFPDVVLEAQLIWSSQPTWMLFGFVILRSIVWSEGGSGG